MTGHDHDQHHHHDHDHSELSETELRVRALETILTEKGYVEPAALDLLIETYETKVGPRNGARVVARAWVDAGYKNRLLADATSAIAEFGFSGRQGDYQALLRPLFMPCPIENPSTNLILQSRDGSINRAGMRSPMVSLMVVTPAPGRRRRDVEPLARGPTIR